MGFLSNLFGGNKEDKALREALAQIHRILDDEAFQLELVHPAMKAMLESAPPPRQNTCRLDRPRLFLTLVVLKHSGRRLWSLWSKVGAVGNAAALSTASRPVRAAHRPQIHSLGPGRFAQHSGASERTIWLDTDKHSRIARWHACCRRRAHRWRWWRVKSA